MPLCLLIAKIIVIWNKDAIVHSLALGYPEGHVRQINKHFV